MVTHIVLHTPKKHERRNKQQRASAWTQHSTDLAETGLVIIQMFDHVKCRYQIKGIVIIRQRFGRAEFHALKSTLSAEFQSLSRNVHAFGLTEGSQHLEVRSCSASDVKNARPGWLKLATNLFYETLNNAAATEIPPVTLLNLEKNRVMMLLHFPGKR